MGIDGALVGKVTRRWILLHEGNPGFRVHRGAVEPTMQHNVLSPRHEVDVTHEMVKVGEAIVAADGAWYAAQVCGRQAADGRWEGWLEFRRLGGLAAEPSEDFALVTETETVQPNHTDLEYWMTGLSRVYLEGALERARRRAEKQRLESASALPVYEGADRSAASTTPSREPAGPTASTVSGNPRGARMRAILDPFAVYVQGEGVLRAELGALATDHLRSVAAAFNIASPETAATLTDHELIESIVMAARGRVTRPHEGSLRT